MNKWKKEHQTLSFQFFINKSSIFVLFVLFFHLVYKIPNFNTWTAKHLVQASYTESTLLILENFSEEAGYNDGGVRYLICHTEDNCIQVSPSALREIMNNPDTVTPEDMEEIMDIPDRRSSYLFRLGLE